MLDGLDEGASRGGCKDVMSLIDASPWPAGSCSTTMTATRIHDQKVKTEERSRRFFGDRIGKYGHFIYGSWEPFVPYVTVSADGQPASGEHRRSKVRPKLNQDGIHRIEAVQCTRRLDKLSAEIHEETDDCSGLRVVL